MRKVLGGFGKFVVFLLVMVVLLYVVLFLAQGPIQYTGRGVTAGMDDNWQAHLSSLPLGSYKPFELEVEGGRKLRGLESLGQGTMPVLLWLHGRDQSVMDIPHYLAPLAEGGFRVFAMEYRGYTVMPGETREANLLADAEAMYDVLLKKDDTASRRILAGGVEIGAVLAMKLSTKRDLAGVVAFSIVPDMETALRKRIPVAPLNFLLRDKWDVTRTLPLVSCPVLFVHGSDDKLVPPAAHQALVAKVTSRTTVLKVDGATRETVPTKAGKDVWEAIADFVSRPGK